jgi:hypothetical protein
MTMTRFIFASLVLVAACGGPAKQQPVPMGIPDDHPTGAVTADGKVNEERVYEGECAPPGSRGGCHTITLRPDGTYENFLFDAAIHGTYEIHDLTVTLHATDAGTEELVFSPDFGKLGDLVLKPAS